MPATIEFQDLTKMGAMDKHTFSRVLKRRSPSSLPLINSKKYKNSEQKIKYIGVALRDKAIRIYFIFCSEFLYFLELKKINI